MIIVDTGPIVALADKSDARRARVRTFLRRSSEQLALSPFVLAEADYLIRKLGGVRAEQALLSDVGSVYSLELIDQKDVARCADLIQQYADLSIGIADASVVVLAERYDTQRILTLDHRCFRAIRQASGKPFVILPADKEDR